MTIENANLKKTLSVSDLNRQVKRLLEVSYGQIWVSGEISSLAFPRSGHWYFTLKDDKAQIRCAMFRGFNQRLKFRPKEGDQVIVRAKVSLYEGRGDYQLIVEGMEPAGLGQLQAAFEALKKKLSQEGLFAEADKKPIPAMPATVAVITSATGAVIHDIISVTRRRFPLLEIKLLPVNVQGDSAADEVVQAIELANRQKLADVLIIGRGGGSLEDLWTFNEERVARAIYNSELPTISAVGHEVDFTIADMVADYRAPTPSAAAEKITPDQYELMQMLDNQQRRLEYLMSAKLEKLNTLIDNMRRHLKHPGDALREKKERLQELQQRLQQSIGHRLLIKQQTLDQQATALQRYHPGNLLAQKQQTLSYLSEQLKQAQKKQLEHWQHRLAIAAQTLNTASPLATLSRGYAIVGNNEHPVITRYDEVQPGDKISATLNEGQLDCTVDVVHSENRLKT